MGLPVFREPTAVEKKPAVESDPTAASRSSIRRQNSVRYHPRRTATREQPPFPRIRLASVLGRPIANVILDASTASAAPRDQQNRPQRANQDAPSRVSTGNIARNTTDFLDGVDWSQAPDPRSRTRTFHSSFFDAVPTSVQDLARAQLSVIPPLDSLALPEDLRPQSRRGSTDATPRDLDLLPPLYRMDGVSDLNDRYLRESQRERVGSLRDEWRPASEFNDGLGDRERSWSPDTDLDPEVDDLWETHLTTIPTDTIGITASPSETGSADTLISIPRQSLPTGAIARPSALASALPLPIATTHVCDDESDEIAHLEHLVECYRDARMQAGALGLRRARATLRQMRDTLERMESRRDTVRVAGTGASNLTARSRDEMRAIYERIQRVDTDVGV